MSGFSGIALALAAVLAAAPTADPGTFSDTQTIVVEVPASSRNSPAPPAPSPSGAVPSAVPDAQGHLPATGQDAGMLVAGIILGVGAVAAGALIARSRRRAG